MKFWKKSKNIKTTPNTMRVIRCHHKNLDIEAVQFTLDTQVEAAEWCGGFLTVVPRIGDDSHADLIIYIKSADGETSVYLNDYIVKSSDRSFFRCSPEMFHSMYEVIDGGA